MLITPTGKKGLNRFTWKANTKMDVVVAIYLLTVAQVKWRLIRKKEKSKTWQSCGHLRCCNWSTQLWPTVRELHDRTVVSRHSDKEKLASRPKQWEVLSRKWQPLTMTKQQHQNMKSHFSAAEQPIWNLLVTWMRHYWVVRSTRNPSAAQFRQCRAVLPIFQDDKTRRASAHTCLLYTSDAADE